MTRQDYISQLRGFLSSLPEDERDAAVKFYEEYFEEAENDEETIKTLGSARSVADSILEDRNRTEKSSSEFVPANPDDIKKGTQDNKTNPPKYDGTVKPEKKQRSTTEIVLIVVILVLTFPIWISLAATAFGVLVSIIATIFALVIAFVAVALGLIIGGLALSIAGIPVIISGGIGGGIAMIGAGLVIFAIGMLFSIPSFLIIIKVVPAIFRGIVNLFRKIFRIDSGKEAK